MKTLGVILAALVLTSPAYAVNGIVYTTQQRAPDYSGTVPVGYQEAHRNLVAGLEKCSYSAFVTGTVYTDIKMAKAEVWQGYPPGVFLSVYTLTDKGGATLIEAWVVRPWLGDPDLYRATAAEKMAVEGDKVDCQAAGF